MQKLPPIIGINHHNSHAAAYYVSPFDDAAVIVMDGYGDDAATSVYSGRGNDLQRQWHSHFFNSLGILYTVVTQHLGFRGNHDEGKVMGLAAYGEPTYVEAMRDVVTLSDGRYQVNMDYFDFESYGLAKPMKEKFFQRFGPPRHPEEPLTEHHMDLAYALQKRVEEAIIYLVRGLEKTQESRNLVLTGGVALNCVANAKILSETAFRRIWIPPNASDTGATFGSALWHYHNNLGNKRSFQLEHASYGKEYTDNEIENALRQLDMEFERLDDVTMHQRVAKDLADGKIVGWFQGRFEMGPRALGNRSILADPRRPEMKGIINARVKHREAFRPFAPAVLIEHAHEWFEIEQPDPFMTIAPRVRTDKVDLIPSGVHHDGTGRIQTVSRESNSRYYDVISEFHKLTGVPVLLNTSFNSQEPIVATPTQAVSCFFAPTWTFSPSATTTHATETASHATRQQRVSLPGNSLTHSDSLLPSPAQRWEGRKRASASFRGGPHHQDVGRTERRR